MLSFSRIFSHGTPASLETKRLLKTTEKQIKNGEDTSGISADVQTKSKELLEKIESADRKKRDRSLGFKERIWASIQEGQAQKNRRTLDKARSKLSHADSERSSYHDTRIHQSPSGYTTF